MRAREKNTENSSVMGTINRLPEAVRNTVRSGTVLFDLTRVVEELVFNSVDAGATKVINSSR